MLAASVVTCLTLAASLPAQAGYGDRPGDFDYYALVLSWSPSFCLSGDGAHSNDPQCSTSRPYAFVVHGLWPQFNKGWPSNCDTGRGDSSVPQNVVRSILDVVPTEKLIQHEWATHGTCSGLPMTGYFDLARRLYKSITIPSKYVNLASPLRVPVDTLRNDLLGANPQLRSDMIAVDCEKNGNLREIHICYSASGTPAACGRNEIQAKMCRTDLVSLPPVRGAGFGANGGATEPQGLPKVLSPAATQSDNGSSYGGSSSNSNNNNGAYGSSGHHRHHHKKHWYDYLTQPAPN
jgi:ribonuclease T2